MCRICGMSLPGAAALRNRAAEAGPAFKEAVETERAAWRDYSEGKTTAAMRSRRPAELPELPPSAWNDPEGVVAASPEAVAPTRRWSLRRRG
jgi:hypothetical protein